MARLPNKLGIYTTIAPPIIFSLLTKSREVILKINLKDYGGMHR
jgi:hypothetical protein